jgi:SAM-dependent methyltransferase
MKHYFCLVVITACFAFSCRNEPAPSSRYEPIEKPAPVPAENNSASAELIERNRDTWQKPGLVISLLGDLHDKTVADLGAGSGYFSFPLARVAKKVIAIDIDKEAISFMDSIKTQLPEDLKSRFEARLAFPNDPLLKKGEADDIIMVNTYAYINNRVAYLQGIRSNLPKGGRLIVIDFKEKNTPVSPSAEYIIAMSTVQKELLAAGFKIADVDDASLEYQYIVIAVN